jgi:hypothetical protein
MAGFFGKITGALGAASGVLGAVAPFASVGIGILEGLKGAKDAKRAREARQDLMNNRQELRNVTEGMRVSTMGAELQTQEAQRRFATSVDALKSGGVRGLVGGLGQMEQGQQNLQAQIGADLDKQQTEIDRMAAIDESRIRDMKESREEFEIGSLAGEEAAGRERMMSGIGIAAGGLTSMVPEAGEARPRDLKGLGGLSDGGLVGQLGSDKSFSRQFDLAKSADSMDKGLTGLLGKQDLSGLKYRRPK